MVQVVVFQVPKVGHSKPRIGNAKSGCRGTFVTTFRHQKQSNLWDGLKQRQAHREQHAQPRCFCSRTSSSNRLLINWANSVLCSFVGQSACAAAEAYPYAEGQANHHAQYLEHADNERSLRGSVVSVLGLDAIWLSCTNDMGALLPGYVRVMPHLRVAPASVPGAIMQRVPESSRSIRGNFFVDSRKR